MKEYLSRILDMFKDKNAGKIGALVAFLFALLWVLFGFFRVLFILLLTLAGYYIGVRLFSDKEKVKNFLDKIIPPGRFR